MTNSDYTKGQLLDTVQLLVQTTLTPSTKTIYDTNYIIDFDEPLIDGTIMIIVSTWLFRDIDEFK